MLQTIRISCLFLLTIVSVHGAVAQETDLRPIIGEFAQAKKFKDVEAVIEKLGKTGDPQAATSLRALSDGQLKVRTSDGSVFILRNGAAFDPVTGEKVDAGTDDPASFKKVRVKNSLRRKIAEVLSGLTLKSPSKARRMSAAATIFEGADATAIQALDAALPDEADPENCQNGMPVVSAKSSHATMPSSWGRRNEAPCAARSLTARVTEGGANPRNAARSARFMSR